MPIDDRSDLDRLTRTQLYNEAAAWGIQHPPDMPKYLWKNGQIAGGMVSLLESAGVSRENMKTISWRTIYPTEQERAAAAHQGTATSEQHYPIIPTNQSARDGVDTSALLQERLAKAEAVADLQTGELDRLKSENASLRAALSRLDELESRMEPKKETGQKRRWRLLREAKDKGFQVDNSSTIEELEKLLGQTTD